MEVIMIDLSQIPFVWEIATAIATSIAAVITVHLKTKNTNKTVDKQLKKNGGTSLIDKVDHILSAVKDISSQLQRIEAWKLAWMELSEDPIFVTDPKGHCMWVNNAYSKASGSSLEDLLGNGWIKILHPEDKERVVQDWAGCVTSLSKFENEYRIINQATKKAVPVHCVAKPLKDHTGNLGGNLVGYIGIWYLSDKYEDDQ